ncbi:uncharacterized protein LOC121972472 [Zingiber officinale]|uniref:uncharacterized protein LOC121972472 n=1 Tax=Zingiber officinale TaxID=94328 RepID=UPI001C4CD9D9|nr:uncharacterized protein LOC121972472 [Zingiber officinale]
MAKARPRCEATAKQSLREEREREKIVHTDEMHASVGDRRGEERSVPEIGEKKFHWLEYSPSTNNAYCFYCFLFLNDVNSSNISALVNEGFDNWKRVNQGKTCAFLAHIGSAASSPHTMCERKAENLMRPSQHIDNVMRAQSKEEKEKNRLHLRTSIVTVRWLALQGCAFRGNDESLSSSNRGNFLELVKAFAKMSTKIDKVVLENAPKNVQYIAPEIQKEILHIMANRVRKMVREEVGDKYFCILVDEARDIFKREQMTIILRFVNNYGVLTEKFFAIKTKDVSVIWEFFSHLDNIVNIVTSTKRIAELHTAQRIEIKHMLAIGERDSGSGANQIGNLQRAGATRWSSHYDSVKSLIDFILMELNTRFNESSVELLSLSTALDPKNSFESINIDDICKLAMKFYPEDFTNQDIIALKLIHLVLMLPVSTATTERAFSAMKNVKTTLRNKMEDEFLEDCLTLYIERDLAKDIDIDSIIDEFYVSKSRRAQLC